MWPGRGLGAQSQGASGLTAKILIIGPGWVGDMVMSQSLLMTLKRRRPAAVIDVVAPAWNLPLLRRMPEVNRAILAPFGHGEFNLKGRRALGGALRQEGYDQAIVLPNSFKSALLPWFAGIPRRTGWRGEWRYGLLNDLRRLDKKRFPKLLDRYNALAFEADQLASSGAFPEPHPSPRLSVDPRQVEITLASLELSAAKPVVALCPGAEYGVSKRWPAERFAEVAKRAAATGHQVWLLGSAKDAATCASVSANVPAGIGGSVHNLAGKTSLEQAVDLLSRAAVVVSNDSGLMHVAAALNRPLIAIYGSSSPEFTPPTADHKRIVRLGLACSPCYKRDCPLGHGACMANLGAAPVLAAFEELASPR